MTSIFGLWVFFFTVRTLRCSGGTKKETNLDRWAPSSSAVGAASSATEMERSPAFVPSTRRDTNRGGGATPVTLRGVDLPDL